MSVYTSSRSFITCSVKSVIWISVLSIVLFFVWKNLTYNQSDLILSSSSSVNPRIKSATSDNRKVWDKPPPGTQMGELQIAAICKALGGNGNLIVWGLGNDSPFWHDSTHGKVVFIEPAGVWYDKILGQYPYLEAYKVKYTTDIDKSYAKYIDHSELWSELDLSEQLPPLFKETRWDVIIVDSPTGYKKGTPGRFQSIYTSLLLAKNGTHVFVDDYERKVESDFSNKMLGSPIAVVTRPERKGVIANKQAHFLIIK